MTAQEIQLELLLLDVRKALSGCEMLVRQMHEDSAHYGTWRCDWNKAYAEAQESYELAKSRLEDALEQKGNK